MLGRSTRRRYIRHICWWCQHVSYPTAGRRPLYNGVRLWPAGGALASSRPPPVNPPRLSGRRRLRLSLLGPVAIRTPVTRNLNKIRHHPPLARPPVTPLLLPWLASGGVKRRKKNTAVKALALGLDPDIELDYWGCRVRQERRLMERRR